MFDVEISEINLRFDTTPRLFCPNSVDRGTLAMLSVVDLGLEKKILDLGCGYGVVGIYAAHCIEPSQVYMVDVDDEAVEISRLNAKLNNVTDVTILKSDGVAALDVTDFSLILCNPPYQTDFAVAKSFIEKGFNRLCIGGRMIMVTKRRLWYKNKLIATFGGVGISEIDGYNVFIARKTSNTYINGLKRKKR
jgi:16S rRNA (guanine1207-N2)-methyltransferase